MENIEISLIDEISIKLITLHPGIYCITNKINGKQYIGLSINIKVRIQDHINRFRAPTRKDKVLYNAFEKYGLDNFTVRVLFETNLTAKNEIKVVLDDKEKYFIQQYNTFSNGYNCTIGGDGSIGFKHSEETKAKIRRWNIDHNSAQHLRKTKRTEYSHNGASPTVVLWIFDLKTKESFKVCGYNKLREIIKLQLGINIKTNSFSRAIKLKLPYYKRLIISKDNEEYQILIEKYIAKFNNKIKTSFDKIAKTNLGYRKIKNEEFLKVVEKVLLASTDLFFIDLDKTLDNICQATVANYLKKWNSDVEELKNKYNYTTNRICSMRTY